MSGNYRSIREEGIGTVKNKIAYVICGYAGAVSLREAVIFDLDLSVVVEAFDVTAAFADVDNRSSPLAVFAIVKEVALN